LDAGNLRHRVCVEAVVRTADDGGGATESWTTVAETWADIKPANGSELVAADRRQGRVSHVIHTRVGIVVEPEMRLRLGQRIFEIRAVMDLSERRRWFRILAEEREL
jgi:SPP1 family predicted phage head-tail adaptor